MILAIAILVVAAAGFYFQDRSHRITLNNAIGAYENSLAWERTRVDNLVVQIQANSQGVSHFPTLGPSPEAPEKFRAFDDTGLIEYELDHEPGDEDFIEAADL